MARSRFAAGLALGAACGLAVKAYDFLQGEDLLHDLPDELWLRRVPIEALETAYRRRPPASDLVISLTTIPSRLPYLELTLKSLLRQTRRPARIRLNLPSFSRRERRAYEVPCWLEHLSSVEVVPCEDLGPATKVLPTLRDADPRQRVLAVDDDRVYPPSLVEQIDRWSGVLPEAAIGLSGWIAPPDLTDRPTTLVADLLLRPPVPIKATRIGTPREVDVLQGLAGYVVRPRYFDLDALCDYSTAPPAARMVDDVWIAGHCRARRFVVPSRRTNFPPWIGRGFYGRTALGRLNRGGGEPNNRSNTIMLRYFAGRWPVGGR